MRRLVVLTMVVILVGLLLVNSVAASAPPPPTCSDFKWTQTYQDGVGFYQAPAWYYGETVTIVYEARNCNFFQQGQGRFVLHLNGIASVYSGTAPTGDPIDVRPFHNTETWQDATNTWGWPANWWQCSVKQAQYKWTIPGVYDFTATAHKGYWTYKQTAFTSPPQHSGGEFDACQ